jgi:hypothetical protein
VLVIPVRAADVKYQDVKAAVRRPRGRLIWGRQTNAVETWWSVSRCVEPPGGLQNMCFDAEHLDRFGILSKDARQPVKALPPPEDESRNLPRLRGGDP